MHVLVSKAVAKPLQFHTAYVTLISTAVLNTLFHVDANAHKDFNEIFTLNAYLWNVTNALRLSQSFLM